MTLLLLAAFTDYRVQHRTSFQNHFLVAVCLDGTVDSMPTRHFFRVGFAVILGLLCPWSLYSHEVT